MRNRLYLILLAVLTASNSMAQVYNEMDEDGFITQRNEFGDANGSFNPNKRDSLGNKNKEVPKGLWVWTVDRRFGDITPALPDTMPHLYQNSIYATGLYGEYNTTGNNFTPRLSRIFIDRPKIGDFFFTDTYSYMTKEPDEFLFTNTLSPYTNISYDNCGDKQNGEDHIDAKFAVNANKRLGVGFDLDYYYARGYYLNQNTSHFRGTLYGSYRGDRYQMHLMASAYHRKATENGGITNDNYITHPELYTEQYAENEIPTVLSKNWNRNDSKHLFLTHRYSFGFYRKVKMTEEEIKARQFAAASAKQKKERENEELNGKEDKDRSQDKDQSRRNKDSKKKAVSNSQAPMGRPAGARIMGDEPEKKAQATTDATRVQVTSTAMMDSLMAEKARQDSIDATIKREYVPVTSIIHTLDINSYDRIYQAYATPENYYAKAYYDRDADGTYSGDSIYDHYRYTSVKNTFALALLEGFNKYMKAGLKGFISYESRRFSMPELLEGSDAYHMSSWTGHCLNIGGQMSKTQGQTFHFDLAAELGVTGMDAGSLAVDFKTDLNFPLLGDTVRLAANAWFHRTTPRFFMNNFHSKHLWWENNLDGETRTHLEGIFSYDKTHTRLRVALDEIQNYTYFGMSYVTTEKGRTGLTGGIYQEHANINVMTLQLQQNLQWGIINWENRVTYQNSSMPSVLPLPDLNLFSNLFLKFKIAKVLSVELGGCMTYFTPYYAPDYLPQISQFAVQQNGDSRVKIGGYPYFDVYANMHLKRARFFLSMSHVNGGSGTKDYFLTPHYPTNTRIMRFGVSWNFYN